MPELPEVETVVRDLRLLLVGKRFTRVQAGPLSLRTKWLRAWEPRLRGALVSSIRRRGKWILVDLDVGGLLVLHLGMTGQLTVVAGASAVENHTHLIFPLDDGRLELRFRDIRRFGSATLYIDEGEWESSLDGRLGPEPFDLKKADWHAALGKSARCLKAILLDQSAIAGVGNIYADESLFAAKIDPRQRGSATTPAQAERLRKSIVAVLTRAIAGRGSTIRDYVGGSGLRGQHQERLAVYGRTGKPCVKCKTVIECIRLAGRSTHYCPQCQPLAASRSVGI